MLFASEWARPLISMFDGISGIDRAHVEELLSAPGMGIAKTAQLKAAIEIGKRVRMQIAQSKNFNNAAAVADYIRPGFEGKRQECFLAIFLDGQNRLLAEKNITDGIPTQATVKVRRAMAPALRVSASAFVVAHNLPSGHPNPSPADGRTTQEHQFERGVNTPGLPEIQESVFIDRGLRAVHRKALEQIIQSDVLATISTRN